MAYPDLTPWVSGLSFSLTMPSGAWCAAPSHARRDPASHAVGIDDQEGAFGLLSAERESGPLALGIDTAEAEHALIEAAGDLNRASSMDQVVD